MYESAYKYRLQYFFTTHSMSSIRYLKIGKHHERSKLIYLQNISGNIKVTEDPSLKDIENNLNVEAGRKSSGVRIKVYCEDGEGLSFVKAILPSRIKKHIDFVTGIDLSWTIYKILYEKKVPEFHNNVIVLDGDVKKADTGWKRYPKNKNIVMLPTEMAPEKILYEFLYGLEQDDPFWDNSMSGYSRDVCFRDNPNHLENIDDIKVWYKSQKDFAGRGYARFINAWRKEHLTEVDDFIDSFVRAYNYVAKKVGSPIIYV